MNSKKCRKIVVLEKYFQNLTRMKQSCIIYTGDDFYDRKNRIFRTIKKI